jgi:hypothetical protein
MFLTISIVGALHPIAIKVCKNKHCTKRAGKNVDILQTISNLLPSNSDNNNIDNRALRVEGSSCLSHCDMGPNIEVTLPNGTSVLLNRMENAETCAFQLENLVSEIHEEEEDTMCCASVLSPSKILIAAAKVMEQCQQFPNIHERIRYLTSVINKLQSSPIVPSVEQTPANAHAHALRAQAYSELPSSSSSNEEGNLCYDQAIRDARRVVQEFGKVATPTSLAMAYRTWADAEQGKVRFNNQKDYRQSIAVLQQWYSAQPSYRSKVQQEIQELMNVMGQ